MNAQDKALCQTITALLRASRVWAPVAWFAAACAGLMLVVLPLRGWALLVALAVLGLMLVFGPVKNTIAQTAHTYLFGDLRPDEETAQHVLTCAALHATASDGNLPRNDRPERLRSGILARLPPSL